MQTAVESSRIFYLVLRISSIMLLLVATVIVSLAHLNSATYSDYIVGPTNTGVIVSAFTPVNEDQSLNLGLIPEYADYLYSVGVRTVLITSIYGEGPAMSLDDRKRVVSAWLDDKRNNGLDVCVQVGGVPLPDVLELARYSADRGASCIVTLPDLYYTAKSIDDLIFYVKLVANEVPNTPLIYNHNPNNTGVDLFMPDFVRAACDIPNFRGIEFDDNDLVQMDQTLRALGSNQELYVVHESLILPAAVLGVRSSITSSLFPDLVAQVFDNVAAGNLRAAQETQQRLTASIEAVTLKGDRQAVAGLKAAMPLVTGLDLGPPLLPQQDLTNAEYNQIKNKLQALGYGCNSRRCYVN